MEFNDQELIQKVKTGDWRAIARLMTLVEDRIPRARAIQAELFKMTGRAHVIGITGSPGAGKSTLVDQLALALRKSKKKVAIIAVDPTSPFSGGAILGDRIRMAAATGDAQVFVRSMATRGALGGVSRATLEGIQILDAAGFDFVLVETVGVGQAEVDIVRTVDTCLVVLVPGMGDGVQIIKAGILEIADVFVINKADREGADLLQRDLQVLLSLTEPVAAAWQPPIVRTVATTGAGSDDLIGHLAAHKLWLRETTAGAVRQRNIIKDSIMKLAAEIFLEEIISNKPEQLQRLIDLCFERKLDPLGAVQQLLK